MSAHIASDSDDQRPSQRQPRGETEFAIGGLEQTLERLLRDQVTFNSPAEQKRRDEACCGIDAAEVQTFVDGYTPEFDGVRMGRVRNNLRALIASGQELDSVGLEIMARLKFKQSLGEIAQDIGVSEDETARIVAEFRMALQDALKRIRSME